LLVRSYKKDVPAVARHLKWPEVKVQAAVNYAETFSEEINAAMAENEATDFEVLKRARRGPVTTTARKCRMQPEARVPVVSQCSARDRGPSNFIAIVVRN